MVRLKIQAATIIETLVASIIILVIFSIALSVFSQVTVSSVSKKTIIATEAINVAADSLTYEHAIASQEILVEGFVVKNEILETISNRCLKIKFRAFDHNTLIKTEQRILLFPHEN